MGVFESEGHEDCVALLLEVLLGDPGGRSKLVELVESGHEFTLVDWCVAPVVPALLAPFALLDFALVALSDNASLVCALTSPSHVERPDRTRVIVRQLRVIWNSERHVRCA
jgi:hypothetical protein